MNWFWFALIALICWSGSDLFSKIGCCGEKDKTAHLKMVVAVGLVMGLHAAYMIVFHHVSVTWDVVWTYLPVSLLYILSMTLGYVGLRYIELSISSPICNSSGALVAVLCLCTGALSDYNGPQKAVILCAVGLVCLGVVGLGVVEAREDDDLRRRRGLEQLALPRGRATAAHIQTHGRTVFPQQEHRAASARPGVFGLADL